ncbi:hypothetical protein M3I01_002345 [Marinomonas sp. RSW2]|uniref:Uncharacterized protein n=1 Tax=Marinomonas maritima TaxID=2940935 RepID=A0ABT5WBP2_9GAMM|nr:hypothetical protein [Marinomonas maritima]MDE8601769.1 hypothetical protein [Marinomonas maritima]
MSFVSYEVKRGNNITGNTVSYCQYKKERRTMSPFLEKVSQGHFIPCGFFLFLYRFISKFNLVF